MSPTTGWASRSSPSVGNHDRKAPPGVPPGTAGLLTPGVQGDLANYKQVFADRPYPFGDAAPYKDAGFTQRTRPADDPPGASSHYFVDYKDRPGDLPGQLCWGLADCDASQNPAFPDAQGNRSQLDYLRSNGGDASRAGQAGVRGHAHAHARPARPELHRPHHVQPRDGQGPQPHQAPRTTCASRRPPSRPAWTACCWATSRASSSTRAAAGCRTTSTAAPAASCTPTARWAPTTATGTASGCCAWRTAG